LHLEDRSNEDDANFTDRSSSRISDYVDDDNISEQ